MTLGILALDNVAVAFALGPLRLGARRAVLLGVAFGLAEGGMTLAGAALGADWLPGLPALDGARAGALATLAVAVAGLAWIRCRPGDFVAAPAALVALALLLGLDNLVAGAAGADAATGAVAALVTGVLAAAACAAGDRLFARARAWGAVASGAMLAGLALAAIG
jgi:hypothetical protein